MTGHRGAVRLPSPPSRRWWPGALLVPAALALGACGGASDPPRSLDAGAAAVLADRAERVAALLDADDPCAADAEVADLRAHTSDQRDDGAVPEEVAVEVLAVLADLDAAITCDADADGTTGDDAGGDDGSEPDSGQDDGHDDSGQDDSGQDDGGQGGGGQGGGQDGDADQGNPNRGGGQGRGRGRGDDPPGRGEGRG